MRKDFYSTQQVARMLGISKQTLLHYEKRKIFPPPHRNPINKRREYSRVEVTKLRKILGRDSR